MTMTYLDDSGAISLELAGFITSHLSIHIAACSESLDPTLVRALGCRVSEDRRSITILFSRSQSTLLQQLVMTNGRVAVVFNEPETHRTIQFKGDDAVLGDAEEADKRYLPIYLKAFSQRLKIFDVPDNYIYALCHCDREDLMSLTFSPSRLYQQTPGQQAGQALV